MPSLSLLVLFEAALDAALVSLCFLISQFVGGDRLSLRSSRYA